MATSSSSAAQRKLFMHSAHRKVGVSGSGIAIGPYYRTESVPSDGFSVAPAHVALVVCKPDADAQAALRLFEQVIWLHSDLKCCRVDLDAVDAGLESLADADCVVLLGRQLRMARHWLDLDLDAAAPVGEAPVSVSSSKGDGEPMKIELAAGARWHPVLEGVGPFMSGGGAGRSVCVPEDAMPLLISRTAGEVLPVAWARHCRHGRVFCAALGSAEDFRQPDFVRLVLNALAWIGR